MAKERKDEVFTSYIIPFNFIDESKMFGGMVKTRNFVEGCVCAFLASIPVFILPFGSIKFKLILFIILVMPALVFGCIGINGDPISVFLMYYFKFRKTKRIVSFNNKVKLHERIDIDELTDTELPKDKLFKLLDNLGLRREKADEEEMLEAEDFIFDDDLEEIKKKEEKAKQMLKSSYKYTQTKLLQGVNSDALSLLDSEDDSDEAIYETDYDTDYDDQDDYFNADDIYDDTSDDYIDTDAILVDDADSMPGFISPSEVEMISEDNNDASIMMLSGDFIDDYKETKIVSDMPPITPVAKLIPDEAVSVPIPEKQHDITNVDNIATMPQNAPTQEPVMSDNITHTKTQQQNSGANLSVEPAQQPIVSDVSINPKKTNPEPATTTSPVQMSPKTHINNTKPPKKSIILPWMCECGTRNLNTNACSRCGNPKT